MRGSAAAGPCGSRSPRGEVCAQLLCCGTAAEQHQSGESEPLSWLGLALKIRGWELPSCFLLFLTNVSTISTDQMQNSFRTRFFFPLSIVLPWKTALQQTVGPLPDVFTDSTQVALLGSLTELSWIPYFRLVYSDFLVELFGLLAFCHLNLLKTWESCTGRNTCSKRGSLPCGHRFPNHYTIKSIWLRQWWVLDRSN